jgi:hypothetical protein
MPEPTTDRPPIVDRPGIPAAIRPRKVLAWTDFMANPTRFRFE